MAMFSNAKVGERVYDWTDGWGTIINIHVYDKLPLEVKLNNGIIRRYTLDGYGCWDSNNPVLFWDKPKFEIPKKPFDLKAEYQKLKRKEFVYGESNYAIQFVHDDDEYGESKWYYQDYQITQNIGSRFYKEDYIEDFVRRLNEHKISILQLEKAIKEVEDENKQED